MLEFAIAVDSKMERGGRGKKKTGRVAQRKDLPSQFLDVKLYV